MILVSYADHWSLIYDEDGDGDDTGYSPPAYVDCALADGLFPDPHNCRGSVFQF